ncbi:MAG: maleylpyruvate isomerase family mycothiol-dependent enzyme [Actinomycetota bacterium]
MWERVDLRATLADECQAIGAEAGGLDETRFDLPTRLPRWSVREILGHVWRDMDRLRWSLGRPAPQRADVDAISYWRSYDPVEGPKATAGRAIEAAHGFADGAELVASFETNWRAGIEAASSVPDERLVETWGPAMRLDDFLATRVLELAVHRLDLADALRRPGVLDHDAAIVTGRIFVGLLGVAPHDVAWTPTAFAEKATGRHPLTLDEIEALGLLADRLPLIR